MNKFEVYCEPFCIREGVQFEIHQVSYDENADYSCFMHFHEVHEIIVFDHIEGSYFYGQGTSALEDDDVVFTPSLETHDFELSDKAKSWSIIQFLPEFLTQPGLEKEAAFLRQGMHLRLKGEHLTFLKQQVSWLQYSYLQNPLSNQSLTLLKLLIIWLVEHAIPVTPPHTQPIHLSKSYVKLEAVINLFRHSAHVDMSLVEAAELCHISTSYFSRLFKSVFRCNFSEYTIRHKLYSAARMLSQEKASITEISYELNFSNPSHFIALFKKQFGITPKKYRTQMQQRIDS
ncbi:helix-turn-helix transcriptional regulator [Echinimonas agarilytica]|uniref:AraC family transcriptional regulator n=1 Tax=Echinimonas agarilytica TaxID=1215918 RepID=A0AA42B7L0_9GAMM|nr:AraC family transcriptional regulator [Echinimonas agarilytica]MCM2679508.1 AraC family transcriptional regulator [Echinimonas agarilytica]